ncbi:hypothetical protein [Thalassoglobus neptunius]|uniref:hypothetical protein n=1 Tax=Thalassoglobus neptunius TaxID=1938619 RepID=UPI0011B4210A|nr:hypothetical protein [Thalassoglobus neptunius]
MFVIFIPDRSMPAYVSPHWCFQGRFASVGMLANSMVTSVALSKNSACVEYAMESPAGDSE